MALVMNLAGRPEAGISGKGPEERECRMTPDRIKWVGKDVSESVLSSSK